MKDNGIPLSKERYYLKWLRFYWDFCHKYGEKPEHEGNLCKFIDKLTEKNQSESQRNQARHAIGLYYAMSKPESEKCSASHPSPAQANLDAEKYSPHVHASHGSFHTTKRESSEIEHVAKPPPVTAGKIRQGADWTNVYFGLKNAISIRHYSPSTLQAYTSWTRKFQAFTRSKDPSLLDAADVKRFLSWLAIEEKVSASSQNLAFNALLFVYRHVLGQEFGKLDGVVRAKKKPYIPVVLSREEVFQIIDCLESPYTLLVSLMYGCGLRISECLSLRVQNFNFDMGILTIHDGKGKKDRTVPLPERLLTDLKVQFERVGDLHERDCRAGFDGVFLFDQLEKRYKNAAKEVVWQWFFPARKLTDVPESGERRRYHIHKTVVQKSLRKAVQKARVPKRVTSHTFRHSYASHLLQANYDIRTIQELLGHSDVRTTMIYTHTVKSTTKKDAKSPLDF